MSSIAFDIQALYQTYFGSKPKVGALQHITGEQPPFQLAAAPQSGSYAPDGSLLTTRLHGVEIWLPTVFRGLDDTIFESGQLKLPYSVISIGGSLHWINTKLSKRKGTVKELYSINDYTIKLTGFLIDRQRVWPYDDLHSLRGVYEAGQRFGLDNALSNIFLNGVNNVVITAFDLPPVQGKSNHVRPFNMELLSDAVIDIEVSQLA